MIYIIEGVDGSGKSSLAKYLSMKTGYKIVKGSSFEQSECTKDDLFKGFFNKIIEYPQVIFDRFHISNVVYSSIYDGYASIDDGEKRFLESMLEINGAKLIYLYADVETLQERIKKRGDDKIKPEEIEAIVEKYEEVFEETKYPYTRIDTTKFSPVHITDMILNLN